MPARALSMPPWVRTITPDIPAGGGTTDAAQADTAAPQAQDRESETPEDSNDSGNDDEGDPEPADEPAGDVAVWKKYARTWETRAKENKKKPPTPCKPSLMPKQVKPSRPRKPSLKQLNANRQPKPLPRILRVRGGSSGRPLRKKTLCWYSPRMRRPFANHGTLVWRWRR